MLLGDFIVRAGVLGPDEECWRGVVGRHGLDERSEADKGMLLLCVYMNQLNVMNT